MLLPTVVILKHTKKEFICSPISAYFGGLIAFKKKQQRPTLAQRNKSTETCLAEPALVREYRAVPYRKAVGVQDRQVLVKRIWEGIFNFKEYVAAIHAQKLRQKGTHSRLTIPITWFCKH